ncbi:MAG: RNA polymerase sigma-70 factor [Bacteroidetes bacterium]|nr:MAG: RNA polymerase sigma-70 factor [Bacteroidota bacterium]
MEYSNQQLINGIKQGDITAFEELYKQYYIFLCLIAEHIVRNPSDAEEIVSDVFVKLWNIREKIDITTSIKAYLVKAVHNTSINYLERPKISNKLTDSLSNSDYKLLAWDSDYPLGQLYEKEIMIILDQGINTLPDACREIFILSRNEGMTYYKIAGKLGISVNTVKTQMKIALARLRENLKDYLMFLLLFMGI